MTRRLLPFAAIVTLLAIPSVLPAQATGAAGPRLIADRAGVTVTPIVTSPAAIPLAATLQPPALRKRGVPQMVIGGVAIVGGALIGDDIGTLVSLAGLGYGIYGLYLYLN